MTKLVTKFKVFKANVINNISNKITDNINIANDLFFIKITTPFQIKNILSIRYFIV